jgi:hypothetical protein
VARGDRRHDIKQRGEDGDRESLLREEDQDYDETRRRRTASAPTS